MSVGEALLALLDATLPADEAGLVAGREQAGGRRGAGLAAAGRLHDLLARHRFGWGDLLPDDSRLAKLCGRLGSDYPAEREAAYDHAVRLILRRRTSWSALARLPEPLRQPPVGPPAGPSAGPPKQVAPQPAWLAAAGRLRRRVSWWAAGLNDADPAEPAR